jgi:AcrR family transcriptional regulator
MPQHGDRGATTRTQLIEVATRLFAARGYEATSIEAVLDEAGVSRGALYHHFASKEALFEAVFSAVEDRIGEEVTLAAAGSVDAVAVLRAGCLAWVQLAGDPVVQRIVLVDAPAVLGWERWRELENQHALGLLKGVLASVADTGRLPADLVDTFAHVLLASVNEIALLIARSDDSRSALRSGERAVDELLSRLLGS